jgi:hypothetical protein
MVAGADTLLDKLSNRGTTMTITLSADKSGLHGFETLKRILKTHPNGCIYL